MSPGGAGAAGAGAPRETLLESIRAAAHAAVDADDGAAAAALTRLIEERAPAPSGLAPVASLDAARLRRRLTPSK